MRPLEPVLRDFDLGHLRIVAELWGVELAAGRVKEASAELARAMLSPAAAEVAGALPAGARQALDALLLSPEGRAPFAAFVRQFGEIREMGPSRRDRERPWRSSASATEVLWYRGLAARSFDLSPQGPQEFIFIPDDLRDWLPAPTVDAPPGSALGHPFGPVDKSRAGLATTAIVDDACTLLAFLQRKPPGLSGGKFSDSARTQLLPFLLQPQALDLTLHLLVDLDLIAGPGLKLDAAKTRPFLESSRVLQLSALARAWRESTAWNDLFHVPGLVPEGAGWRNDPVVARSEILGLLSRVPRGEWWSLKGFVAAVKAAHPDFQRPAGDYESWYIRDARTGDYLRGFEHWERVDGALIEHMIVAPLHWLGAVDLGSEAAGGAIVAFRLSRFSAALLGVPGELRSPEPPARLRVSPGGRIRVPRAVSRYERFQVARFSEWVGLKDDEYEYRLSPASLAAAGKQGIRLPNVLTFLRKSSETPVPKTLESALGRAEQKGAEATVQPMIVLRVKSAEVLQRLRQSPKTRRFLGEPLGELAVEVKGADWQKLVDAAGELGILMDTT